MPTMKKLTPILYVDRIEPAIPFWVDRLGFELVAEVPHGEHLGFLILQKDGIEIMYQTRASVHADAPELAARMPMEGTFLFIEVEDLDAVEGALHDVERVVPRRKTPYGAVEIYVREPAGNLVGFAQFG